MMIKFKALLSLGLFALGLFYWSLNQFNKPVYSSPYKTIYAITGNENTAVEILKCADYNSVKTVTAIESCCSSDFQLETQKVCLEDWMEKKVVEHN